MLKVLHVAPSFYPATYWGGPIYSAYGLCNALAKIPGVTLRVLTTDSAGPSPRDSVKVTGFPMKYPGDYEVFFCRQRWVAGLSIGMLLHLWPMIRWADVVHLTVVYSLPTIPTLLICRLMGTPVVWSPRGALQRWEKATNRLIKKVWERVCNVLISREHSILHFTSEQEAIGSKGRISKVEFALVPNGVDIPEVLSRRTWRPGGRLRLLYLGRLHRIKGIENLLLAIKAINGEAIELTIFGSGDGLYLQELRALVRELQLEACVSFRGHVDEEARSAAFMEADVCVVPSFTENFGMVVAEALAHGVPVIASRGAPWGAIETKGCGLWVANDRDSLAEAIRRMRNRDLPEMGARGRAWMRESFGWDSIGDKMFQLYKRACAKD